jgi:hypothetical protein
MRLSVPVFDSSFVHSSFVHSDAVLSLESTLILSMKVLSPVGILGQPKGLRMEERQGFRGDGCSGSSSVVAT